METRKQISRSARVVTTCVCPLPRVTERGKWVNLFHQRVLEHFSFKIRSICGSFAGFCTTAVASVLSDLLLLALQSKLGYLTLFFCTLHTYLYGSKKFLSVATYKWFTPPGYMLSLVLPTVVIVLKLLILLPCVDRRVARIRRGWERSGQVQEESHELLVT